MARMVHILVMESKEPITALGTVTSLLTPHDWAGAKLATSALPRDHDAAYAPAPSP